jgi:hypothetical protein
MLNNSSIAKKAIELKKELDSIYSKNPAAWNSSRASVLLSLEDHLTDLDEDIQQLVIDETDALVKDDFKKLEIVLKSLQDIVGEMSREIERIKK